MSSPVQGVEPGLAARDLRSRVLRNTGAQMVGRVVIALSRLVVAAIVARAFGAATFGEYALIFGLLAFAEWIADFGTTEIFVREVSRDPARQQALLRIATALKLFQAPLAFGALAFVVLAMHYPEHVVHAALVGGASLAFHAGILVYRVVFKAQLTLEREVAAEFVSVLAMIAMVVATVRLGGGLVALFACHAASRAIFLALCVALGRGEFRFSVGGVTARDLRQAAAMSMTIGVIGLLVAVYEMLDVLLLSKLGDAVQLGYYSGAQRVVWPAVLALGSVGATLYPIAARYWPADPARFASACQRGLDAVLVLAGVAIASMLAGAEFFLGLLGPELVAGAPALRLLALLVFLKAITSTLGPVLYVVRAQRQTLVFIAVAVAMKAAAIAALAIAFGYLGVAMGALAVELCFAVVPTVLLVSRHGALRLRWSVAVRVAAAIAAAATACTWLLPGGGLAAAILAPVAYLLIAAALGALRVSDIRMILRRGAP